VFPEKSLRSFQYSSSISQFNLFVAVQFVSKAETFSLLPDDSILKELLDFLPDD
jgi:hypothetical protein